MYISSLDLEKELQEIEKHRFNLAMIDRWDKECFETDDRLFQRELEIKETLKERGEMY